MLKNGLYFLCVVFLMVLFSISREDVKTQGDSLETKSIITVRFPSKEYPETAMHIREAIARGKTSVCTVDRKHAVEHRGKSLRGIPVRKGKDRDEWPMAMCREGGSGADVKHISPSDNRGAGAWIKNRLKKYKDGTRIRFIVPKP